MKNPYKCKSLSDVFAFGLNIFYSSQDMIKDQAEKKLCLALSIIAFDLF